MSLAKTRYTATPLGSERRHALCAEALTWLGTPYHHQACLKGVGVDCVHFIIGVARACELLPPDWSPPVYSPEWHLHQHEELLVQTLESLGLQAAPVATRSPGDIMIFQFGHVASHTALLLPEERIIHAMLHDAVRAHGLTGAWRHRLRGVYQFVEPAI